VKEPLEAEFPLLRKGQILFTYLHLAASKSLTEALLKSGVIGIAYETIQVDHRLPIAFEPMSRNRGSYVGGDGRKLSPPNTMVEAGCCSAVCREVLPDV